jgi:predicted O-methyltransferase YrrM
MEHDASLRQRARAGFYRHRKELLDPLAWWLSRRELHRMLKLDAIPAIVEATYSYQGRGHYARIRPSQIRSEVIALATLVRERAPRGVVELGTRTGGSFFIWCRSATSCRRFVSVDLPGGVDGGGYRADRTRLYQEFLADRPAAHPHLLQLDSQSLSTRDRVRELMAQTPIDFLFIDADHRYEGAKRDFELYEPLVAPGGLIAFHDILPRHQSPSIGVGRLWSELRVGSEAREFVQDPKQGRMGIGVLIKPPAGQ